jgi:hypothetical protein
MPIYTIASFRFGFTLMWKAKKPVHTQDKQVYHKRLVCEHID